MLLSGTGAYAGHRLVYYNIITEHALWSRGDHSSPNSFTRNKSVKGHCVATKRREQSLSPILFVPPSHPSVHLLRICSEIYSEHQSSFKPKRVVHRGEIWR